jgi:hypothetical protein
MLKKLTILAAALAVSAPAFADRGHRGHDRHDRHDRRVVVHKHHYVQHRPAPVVYHYYRPAPRPVYVVRHAPPPPVVYHQSHSNAGAALLVGAILGGAIVHSVVTGGY